MVPLSVIIRPRPEWTKKVEARNFTPRLYSHFILLSLLFTARSSRRLRLRIRPFRCPRFFGRHLFNPSSIPRPKTSQNTRRHSPAIWPIESANSCLVNDTKPHLAVRRTVATSARRPYTPCPPGYQFDTVSSWYSWEYFYHGLQELLRIHSAIK